MCELKQKFCTYCGQGLLDRRGNAAFQLYDEDLYKKSKILKLIPCNWCGAPVADKYIECDGTLLLIDLVLQYREAYRHVLFNGNYQSLILRVTLLALICDGYISWAARADSGEFFEQEYQFYIMCSRAFLALSVFLSIIILPQICLHRFSSILVTAQGLLLAYSSRFLNLIAHLWSPSAKTSDGQSPSVMWQFFYMLFFISSVTAFQVTRKSHLMTSLILLTIGHVGFLGLLKMDFDSDFHRCDFLSEVEIK